MTGKNTIRLSDHFTFGRLLRYAFPSIVMLVFTSIYGVVDGFFVSNFVGKIPFAAVNFIMPFLMLLGCVGFLFGTGGGALIAVTLGAGHRQKANQLFSMLVYVSIACGVVLAVLGLIFVRPIARLLGAEAQLLEDSVRYALFILPAIPAYVLQYEFQCLFATALSQCVGGTLPLIYFARPNASLLRLGRAGLDLRALGKVCSNGSSELMSNVSMSLVSMLYNIQLLRYAGEDGVAAYGVLMYLNMIFLAAFLGYSVGTAPVVSFHYGAGHSGELRGLLIRSLWAVALFAVVMFSAAELLARPLSMIFVSYDPQLLAITLRGFAIYSFSFLFAGFSIYSSAFFTALNNGLVSALISFLRALVFQVAAVLVFPLFWQLDGIWFSIVAAEALSALVSALLLRALRGRYHYGRNPA